MHANHFRRIALAQGLLHPQHARAPEPDGLPGAEAADTRITPQAEPAPDVLT